MLVRETSLQLEAFSRSFRLPAVCPCGDAGGLPGEKPAFFPCAQNHSDPRGVAYMALRDMRRVRLVPREVSAHLAGACGPWGETLADRRSQRVPGVPEGLLQSGVRHDH